MIVVELRKEDKHPLAVVDKLAVAEFMANKIEAKSILDILS